VNDLENHPKTKLSPRRSSPLWIAIAVAMAMLMLAAGCGATPETRPREPAGKVEVATTAPSPMKPASKAATTASSPRPAATVKDPFGQVGGWIAYSGVDGIWALDPARPERRIQLSRRGGDPIAWSSEGTKLLIRRGLPGLLARLSVLEPDGTETLLFDGADDPTGGSFSPDGSEIVYAAGAIYAVSSDGGAPRLILRSTRRVSSYRALAYHPALSPDGTRIAYFDGMFDHSHNLWVANADGTGRRVLLDWVLSREGHIRALKWSPDGEWLAFSTDGSIYVVRPDGTGFRPVVTGLAGGASAAQWSPDGSRIAYLREGGSCFSDTGRDADFICGAELVIVNVNGGDEQIIEGIRTPMGAQISWNPAM
jgi:WD domain, G-beta repeat/WD40-like Beta Propeller Repeat